MAQRSPGRLAVRLLAIAIASLVGSACVLAERHHRVGADEFLRLAELPMGSMRHAEFLGTTAHRAYLTLFTAGSLGGEDIYSCEIDALPAALTARIRAGENPWPK
jgi:hypothetical protein